MPTTVTYTNRIPNGGFNRAALPQAAGDNNWYDLVNFQPWIGGLVQTAPYVNKYSLNLLSGESTATRIHYMDVVQAPGPTLEYLVVNETNARYVLPTNLSGSQTKLPCILQTAVPNNTTQMGYAVLSGLNTTDFATDGDYFTIVAVTAGSNVGGVITPGTIKWSKNTGSFTTVTAYTNTAIGSNGLVVSFFNTYGFNPGDTWVWTRSAVLPYSAAITSTANFAYNAAIYQTDIYLAGIGRNVMRVRSGIISSVGYNRIYGKYAQIFNGFLVIAHFAQGAYDAVNGVKDTYNATTTPYTVGWSDELSPDNMVPAAPTISNQAGSYVLPYNTYPDAVNYGITGMAQLYNTLYIYLPDAISQMQYVGLPAVMQILPRFQGVGCYYHNSLVLAKRGHYFLGRDNVYYFNGLLPVPIGEPVRTKLYTELPPMGDATFDMIIGYYNGYQQEVVWRYWTSVGSGYYQARELVYQEKYSRFYFRNAPSVGSGATDLMCTCRVFDTGGVSPRLQYGGKGVVYFDYNTSESTSNIVYDVASNAGTGTMTQPTAETNDFYYNALRFKKEPRGLFIDAVLGSGVTLQPYACGRNFFSTPVSYTTLASWNSVNPEQGVVPLDQIKGNVFRYKFQFQGTQPIGCILNGWSDGYYGANRMIER